MAENSGSSGIASYSIRGHMVVFHEDRHEYYVDGALVPSVTELIRKYSELHGLDDYTSVPSGTMRKAASQGISLHEEIERYEKDGVQGSSEEFRNYLDLKAKCGIRVEASELPVLIFDGEDRPVCAGRLDISGTVTGGSAIIDIKRTARIYKSKAALQLNLCRLGFIQSYGEKCEQLFVMRLRHGASEFARVPVDEKSAYDVLAECLPSSCAKPEPEADKASGAGDRNASAADKGRGAEAQSDSRGGTAPRSGGAERGQGPEVSAERRAREAACAERAEHLREASWFWRFFPLLTAHLLLLMVLSDSVIGWEAALHLVLTFSTACLVAWPILAITPVKKAAEDAFFLGAGALVLKAAAFVSGWYFSGVGAFLNTTGAFVAIAGLVFGFASRGTSAEGYDRMGRWFSGIAYVLCTISSVSYLEGLAGS